MKQKIKSNLFNELENPINQNKCKLAKIKDFQLGKTKLENKDITLPVKIKIHPYPIF